MKHLILALLLAGCSGPEFTWQQLTLTSDAGTVVTQDGGMIVKETSTNVSPWPDAGEVRLPAEAPDATVSVADSRAPDSATPVQPIEAGTSDKCVLVPGAWECELTYMNDGKHHLACCQDDIGTWRCC